MRKRENGETTDDLFGTLATMASREGSVLYPKALPVILTRPRELNLWMNAPVDEVLQLQRPLSDSALTMTKAPIVSS